MLFASFLFAFTGAFAKLLSSCMSSLEVVFFRNIIGTIIISLSIYKLPIKQIGGKPFLLFFRGFIGFIALLMYFYNIAHISLAEAQTFSKTAPIFTAIFAYIFIKEKLTFKAWIGVFIGFIGILFITHFTGSSLSKTDWLGILSGIGAGLAYTSIRELKNIYDTRVIVFSFMITGTIGPILLMILGEFYTSTTFNFMIAKFIVPTTTAWLYIIGLGVTATLSQLYMTKAYMTAKGGIVGTISYSNIIFSIAIGVLLGDSFPDILVVLGIIIIIISGVLVTSKKGLK
ncbi:Putative integral membrane protein [hydrothermal vent metagenome]|uniref:Integral membrane protein n=1 Tax=hydrothermal vent metagenome TaxID=652676 RepID=A0A3B1DU68_9ZZZZ